MRALAAALEAVAAFLLVALMGVTVVDVAGRYLFDAPLPGAFELTELTLGALIFAALPLVGRAGGHVEVDLLAGLLPAPLSRWLLWCAALVAALVLGFFAWRLAELGLQQHRDGTRSISLAIPFAPLALFGAASCLLAAAAGLLRVLRA